VLAGAATRTTASNHTAEQSYLINVHIHTHQQCARSLELSTAQPVAATTDSKRWARHLRQQPTFLGAMRSPAQCAANTQSASPLQDPPAPNSAPRPHAQRRLGASSQSSTASLHSIAYSIAAREHKRTHATHAAARNHALHTTPQKAAAWATRAYYLHYRGVSAPAA
jgi:hypothetical protein